MHALQHRNPIHPLPILDLTHGKRIDTSIGDARAFDQTYPLQLGQTGELRDAVICQIRAAREVDVPDTIARFRQCLDRKICDPRAMSEVDVMQILAQLRNRKDRSIRDTPTLCKNKIP